MNKFLKKVKGITKGTTALFKSKDPVVYSAAVAFFTIFSMPSIIIVIVFFAGLIRQDQAVKQELISQVKNLIGQEGSEVTQSIINNVSVTEGDTLATIFSVLILFISATAIFNFIQKGMNSIWEVKPKPEKGFLKFWRDRLLSFSLIIILGFLMLVSLIIDTVFNLIRSFIVEHFNDFAVLIMTILNAIVTFGITMFIFLLIFKVLPDALIRWKDAFVGALVTAILFTIGKYIIGIILSTANFGNTYAAAGSLAGVLVWVFYSAILLFVGATFTKVYSGKVGREIRPSKAAVRIETRETEIDD